jgi:hypothetical protein
VKTLLALEDNDERIATSQLVVRELAEHWQMPVWRDAPTTLTESPECFDEICRLLKRSTAKGKRGRS